MNVSVNHDREGTAWKDEADLVVRKQGDHISVIFTQEAENRKGSVTS